MILNTPLDYLGQYLESDETFNIKGIKSMFKSDSFNTPYLRYSNQLCQNIFETSSVHSEYLNQSLLAKMDYSQELIWSLQSKAHRHKFYTNIRSFDSKATFNSVDLLSFNAKAYSNSLKKLNNYILPKAHQDKYSDNQILFPGVRYMNDSIVVFEMPPTSKHLSYVEAYREHSDDIPVIDYYVPVPWQTYIAVYDCENMRLAQVQMYFSDSPITSFGHRLYLPPMLNFYSNGELCRPIFGSMEDYEKYPQTISGVIASAYDWVWNSGFNFDITETISEYLSSKNWRVMVENSELSSQEKVAISQYLDLVNRSTNNLDPKIVSAFYKLWSSVPLDKILNCKWISFCLKNNFFTYEFRSYSDDNWDDVQKWVQENFSRELIQTGDDDELPEEYSEEEYITLSEIYSHREYIKWVMDTLHSRPTTLMDAFNIGHLFSIRSFRRHVGAGDAFKLFLDDHAQYLTNILFK